MRVYLRHETMNCCLFIQILCMSISVLFLFLPMFAFFSDRFVHMIFVPNVRRQPFLHHTTTTTIPWRSMMMMMMIKLDDRMEPQCITCDIDSLLWSSRRLYKNCSYFDVYLSPPSSIATDYRVEHYVLECQGPTLPVAGKIKLSIHILSIFFSFVHSAMRK